VRKKISLGIKLLLLAFWLKMNLSDLRINKSQYRQPVMNWYFWGYLEYHMQFRIILLFIFFLFSKVDLYSQTCTALGQNPSTAFPVCGETTFSQNTVPICGVRTVPTPCSSDGINYQDKNPFWYKFTCYTSGTFSFVITPNNLNDDYDWQMFDVTGHNPNDIYTDPSLFICCNWSQIPGQTGASAAGSGFVNCAGLTYPNFSSMPYLFAGHNYLLLVSHFTDSQSGYSMQFTGGTSSIVDPKIPQIVSASIGCDGTQVKVVLNKDMKCSSLTSSGSEFRITPGGVIISATGFDCSSNFDMDSLTLTLASSLPAGTYTLSAVNGTDGNTLLDNCDKPIAVGNSVNFIMPLINYTPMDSITSLKCSPDTLTLVFKTLMRCSSVDADGSDFTITGPTPVTVASAITTCDANGLSSIVKLRLSAPIQAGGIYTIHLQKGNDGNTIINECAKETPAGMTLDFVAYDTVSALFNYSVILGCKLDTVTFFHDGSHGVNSWTWIANGIALGNQQSVSRVFPSFSNNIIQLTVSNGVCSATHTDTVKLNNKLRISFIGPPIICPEDHATFINTSNGNVTSWLWDFGNGAQSTAQNPPPQMYPFTGRDTYYDVSLVGSNATCIDSSSYKIQVLGSCFIALPNAFTPNGDGLNDYFYPINAFKADNFDFTVYDRWGKIVYHSNDWTQKWDGKLKGEPQPSGVYVWTFNYTYRDTGKKYALKGTVMLIR
jgi:gliding motility-associated-like protein